MTKTWKRLSILTTLSTLFLLFPVIAHGSSVNFDTGVFQSGMLTGSFMTGSTINISIMGSLNTIDLKTGSLIQFTQNCPTTSTCFSFSSGQVMVMDKGKQEFFDHISGGITIKNDGSASIDATLVPHGSLKVGSATATFTFSGQKVSSGSEDVSFSTTTVPEPSTLSFIGLGLCLLGGKVWKMKLNG